MRARDIIIIVVARVDRVSSLAGSNGTPRDARARSKDEGWVGCIFLRAVASRVSVETRRARAIAVDIDRGRDRSRSIHPSSRARIHRARASWNRAWNRMRETDE